MGVSTGKGSQNESPRRDVVDDRKTHRVGAQERSPARTIADAGKDAITSGSDNLDLGKVRSHRLRSLCELDASSPGTDGPEGGEPWSSTSFFFLERELQNRKGLDLLLITKFFVATP